MSRAYGWNSRLIMAFEDTYGIAPAAGKYYQLPFASSELDSSQGLIESNVLGLGRDPSQPFQDSISVEGDIAVPLDLRNIGFWLKAIFGNPTSSGDETYQHSFKSGQTSIPSMSIELGFVDVPDYPIFTGARANSIAFNFAKSGEAQATINLIGQGETTQVASKDAAPKKLIYTRFSQFQGSIKQGGQFLGNVTAASITYSNNLEKIETIRNDGKIEAVDPGVASLTGNISVRYADNQLMAAARSGTPIDLEFAYTIDNDRKLVIQCHEVYLPKPKRSISGPGGIEASYDYQGALNNAIGSMATIILTNDVESY